VGRSKKSRLLSSHPPIFDHALTLQVQFYRNARLLPTVARATELAMIVSTLPDYDLRMRKYARLAPPYETNESGNGQLGIFEGLTSDIDIRGTQPQSNGVRCDCITETSASFAVRSVITGNVSDRDVSMNLLNYAHLHAGFHQPWAVGSGKPDPYTTKHTRESSTQWVERPSRHTMKATSGRCFCGRTDNVASLRCSSERRLGSRG
jgi:hypothetical protein